MLDMTKRSMLTMVAVGLTAAAILWLVQAKEPTTSPVAGGALESAPQSAEFDSQPARGRADDLQFASVLESIERRLEAIERRREGGGSGEAESVAVLTEMLAELLERLETGQRSTLGQENVSLAQLMEQARGASVNHDYIRELGRRLAPGESQRTLGEMSFMSYRDILDAIGPPDTVHRSRGQSGVTTYWYYNVPGGVLDGYSAREAATLKIEFAEGMVLSASTTGVRY